MQRKLKLFIVGTAFVLFAAVWFFPFSNNFVEASANAQRALYIQNCARCHGADGKGETKLGAQLDVPDLTGGFIRRKSRGKITSVITNGDGEMPAFGKKLTKAEINSLVNYVRKF